MREGNQHNRLLSAMIELMSTSADKRMSISTCLDVEFDKVPFHLVTNGDSATISFNSISDAFSMFGKMRSAKFLNGSQLQEFESILNHMNITVYLQNRHFGLFGPKAGFFIPKLARLFSAASKK